MASLDILPPSVDVPTCCAPPADDPSHGTKFHFSLNVSSLERSVAFYEVLFGVPPAKHHPDYAKFEPPEPPLVFSLVPNPPSSNGALSHFGLPVESAAEVEAAAARLAAAGLEISCQNGTVCGYARQDKVWVHDPDHNYWEIYVVHEEVDPESVRSGFDGIAPRPLPLTVLDGAPPASSGGTAPATVTRIWEHRVLMPLPDRIPHDDGTVDEVRLEGAFNDGFTAEERGRLLAEALRVLRPGGLLLVHGLVSDRPLRDGLPALPGVAALVKRVPVESEPLAEVAAAGFEGLRITKLPESPVFQAGGAEMREIKLEARKPASTETASAEAPGAARRVLYKGPFASALDDEGRTFVRGIRTEVDHRTWERLARSAAASHFLFLGDESRDDRSCG